MIVHYFLPPFGTRLSPHLGKSMSINFEACWEKEGPLNLVLIREEPASVSTRSFVARVKRSHGAALALGVAQGDVLERVNGDELPSTYDATLACVRAQKTRYRLFAVPSSTRHPRIAHRRLLRQAPRPLQLTFSRALPPPPDAFEELPQLVAADAMEDFRAEATRGLPDDDGHKRRAFVWARLLGQEEAGIGERAALCVLSYETRLSGSERREVTTSNSRPLM